jgi:hypothetical protein
MPEVEFKENAQLIEELCVDHYASEILRFFARHPYARFDKQVLIGGLGLSDNRRIEKTLGVLAEHKLLEIKNEQGSPLYWLTKKEPVNSAVKLSLSPRLRKTGEAFDRLAMMQLILPLTPLPVNAVSAR